MSDSKTEPGSNRKHPRRLLTAVTKAPRKLRNAGLVGLIALGAAAALTDAPAAASASTTTPVSCILPAGLTWHLSGVIRVITQPSFLEFVYTAQAGNSTYVGYEYGPANAGKTPDKATGATCYLSTP